MFNLCLSREGTSQMNKRKCVKCGLPLTGDERLIPETFGMPGTCLEHQIDVTNEVKKHFTLWPSDWHGGWFLDGDEWIYTEPPRPFVPNPEPNINV
jgi:hypothetical protein